MNLHGVSPFVFLENFLFLLSNGGRVPVLTKTFIKISFTGRPRERNAQTLDQNFESRLPLYVEKGVILSGYFRELFCSLAICRKRGRFGAPHKQKNKPSRRKICETTVQILKMSHQRDIILVYMIERAHGGMTMAVSYKRLFHLLIERGMTTTQLQHKAGFSANIVPRMKRNGYISLDTIESICRALDCGVDDILEFVPDNSEDNDGCC